MKIMFQRADHNKGAVIELLAYEDDDDVEHVYAVGIDAFVGEHEEEAKDRISLELTGAEAIAVGTFLMNLGKVALEANAK